MPLPPNHPRLQQCRRTFTVPGAVTFVRRTGTTTPSLIYDVYLYTSVYFFSFLPFTADRYIHSPGCEEWKWTSATCSWHLPPLPLSPSWFTYLFILYRTKASGQESSAGSLLYSCGYVSVFTIQNITMKQSQFFYRNSLVFIHICSVLPFMI